MHEYRTQIIKLQNGTDLIANVALNGAEHYILEEPMEFGLDFRGNHSGLTMRHYLPVQLLKKNCMEIHMKDILSMMEPEQEFCEYYINTVEKIKNLLKAKNLVNEMDDVSDEELQEILDSFSDMDNHGKTLH
jgi:hypothetical protein